MRMIPRGYSALVYTDLLKSEPAKSQLLDVQSVVFGHPFNPSGQSNQPFQSFNPFNNKYVFVLFISP